jgi:sulfur-oxidizing protein SoxY
MIHIKIPKVAENGAIVPITIRSELKDTKSISIIAEKNPVPLIAQFSFAPEMNKQVTARIKLAKTCDVIAIVRANERYYSARQSVQVTIGGCGD